MLNIYASPLPFSNKQVNLKLVPGHTVSEIVDLIIREDLRGKVDAIVFIEGHIIPPDKWHSVKPKDGKLVNVNVTMAGGGGKKNPLSTILSVAVMIAAPQIGAAFGTNLGLSVLGGVGPLTAGQTLFFNGLVSGAFSVVAKLAIGAIAPPPKQNNNGNAVNNPSESPTQFIEGATNQILRYDVVPICLGTNRMFPPQAALPYSETQNNNQYVRQLFTWGLGNKIVLNDHKIGETSIAQFTGVKMEHRLNGDLHLSTGLFSNSVLQDDYSVLLTNSGGAAIRATQLDVDEAIVDITFPRGLCEFDSTGARNARTVQVEVTYSNADDSPTSYSPGVASTPIASTNITAPSSPMINRNGNPVGYTANLVVLDKITGQSSLISGGHAETAVSAQVPGLPDNKIRLSTIIIKTIPSGTSVESYTDDRQASIISELFGAAGDFLVSASGSTITIASGSLKNNGFTVTASQTEALRKSVNIVFPQRGRYNIKLRRITADSSDDEVFDEVYLTAIKNVRYVAPVALEGVNGTAIRMKASDQLNGSIDQYNAIASSVVPDYDADSNTWVDRVTSNCASLFRFVAQGLGNKNPLADSRVDIEALQEWHTYCVEQGYSYNRVIDYDASVEDILRDIAAAGSASLATVDGKYSIVIDRVKDEVVQVVTPRNSSGYTGHMTYPELPHAFRVQFRNANKGYQIDERIVYDDGYSSANATKFETLDYMSCTNANLAFKHGRRHIATARLRPETHIFNMDVEHIVFLRGDRIKFVHDIPLVGVGDARIKEVYRDSAGLVTGVLLDDVITIPYTSNYFMRIRLSDGSQVYKEVYGNIGENTEFEFIDAFEENIAADDLCYVVEAGGELDLIISRIDPADDLTAKITAVDYAPAIFTAENSPIPPFQSNITTPLEFIRPLAPQLIDNPQSDEAVMLRNSDGSLTSRMVITLRNRNDSEIEPIIAVRVSGTTEFTNANILEASPERVILTGLQDNTRYDVHIRYKRNRGGVISLPLEINNYLFEGASGNAPPQVTGFKVSITDSTALFEWDKSEAIDHESWILRYSPLYSGATWETAQLLATGVLANRLQVPFQGGTYFIKDYDISGRVSDDATSIITYDPGSIRNVVEIIEEAPSFDGEKDNVITYGGNSIIMGDASQTAYYYFDTIFDLGDVYPSIVSATIVATNILTNNIFDMDDVFDESDIFGAGDNDIFDIADMLSVEDVFGIGTGVTEVVLEVRTTNDYPTSSDAVWSDYEEFRAGSLEFRGIHPRLKMTSREPNVTPQVTELSLKIDMPDRIERGDDIQMESQLHTIVYSVPFKKNPALAITIQDGDSNDEIEFETKNSSGFSFRVYNANESPEYVLRLFDYIASGYGRGSL